MLARFAFDSRRKVKEDSVKPKAFQPNRNSKVSIFCILDLTCPEIIEIGKRAGGEMAHNKGSEVVLYGWARFQYDALKGTNLRVEWDDTCDYGKHANILNWPDDSGQRLLLQMDLAKSSDPVRIDAIRIQPPVLQGRLPSVRHHRGSARLERGRLRYRRCPEG